MTPADEAARLGPEPGFSRLAAYEAAVGRVRCALVVAGVSLLLSVTLYSYHFWLEPLPRLHETYAVLCRDPFTHAPVHEPQTRHRILGPLAAYAVGLRGASGQAVLVAAGFVFLVNLYLLLRKRWACEPAGLMTVLIATTPVVTTCHTWPGYPDILANIAVLAGMMVRPPWLIGPILFVGMLGDERAVASAPLVALWHVSVGTDARPGRAFVIRGLASAAALAAWLVFYAWVQAEYVRPMADYDNAEFLRSHLSGEAAALRPSYLPGGAYYALRSAWLFPIIFVIQSLEPGRRLFGLAVAAAGLAAALPGIIVVDHSRCIAMCWPVVLIAAERVRGQFPDAFRTLVYAAVVLNVFTPMYDVFSIVLLRLPLPVTLGYHLLGSPH